MTGHAGRSLWLDPGFGASGDMMLGTLIGLGASIDAICAGLETLPVDGWSLEREVVQRCSLSCTRAVVSSTEGHHHRTWSSIDAMLEASGLPANVISGARATFRRLGEVEAGIHNVSIDEVHFHEVGAVDAIVDIVGSWLALDSLNVDHVTCGPVGLGHGSTVAAHGRLPIPAPATTDLLIGASVQPVDIAAETVTPTGAALLTTMASAWEPMPAGRLIGSSRGAGGRDPEHYPNAISAYLLEAATVTATHGATPHQAMVLTTNLDDVTPEVVGHTIARCLDAGADDAWARPIVMKKSRPGVELHVLCAPTLVDALTDLIFTETGSLGLRVAPVTKQVLSRRFEHVMVRGQSIAVKVGPHGAKPEYEDLARAAIVLETTVRALSAEALAVFETHHSSGSPGAELAKSENARQTHT